MSENQQRKYLTSIALLLALVVSPAHTLVANIMGAKTSDAAVKDLPGSISGRLVTSANGTITVNGNSARSGDTIFSGAQIQTPTGVSATVQLGRLGSVDIAANTAVTLTFTDEHVNANAKQVGTSGFIAATSAVNAPCRRGRNPSPGVPRGRNDECRD